jgi:hypothetical protein
MGTGWWRPLRVVDLLRRAAVLLLTMSWTLAGVLSAFKPE